MTQELIDERGPYTCCRCTQPTWNDDDWCDACVAEAAKENEPDSPALSPPAEGEADDDDMSDASLVALILRDTLRIGRGTTDGDPVTFIEGIQEAADYISARTPTPTPAPVELNTSAGPVNETAKREHVDWTVVGPKLVEAVEAAEFLLTVLGIERHNTTRTNLRAALAAAQPEGS